jgi:hypothetical protein
MPSSPKPDLLPVEGKQTLPLSPNRPALPFRRNRRSIPILLSLPLAFLLLYILAPSIVSRSEIFLAPPPYLSHSGKKALETTIHLPRLQFNFSKGEGVDAKRRDMVRDTIERTWRLYAQEAWGWDEVKPVQGGGQDPRYTSSAMAAANF